jgi:hypothetical protein
MCDHTWEREGIDPNGRRCTRCGALGKVNTFGRTSGHKHPAKVAPLLCQSCKAPATTRGQRALRLVALCSFCASVGKAS